MTLRQTIAALVVGLLGSAFIWVAAPYNNFILANAFISDDFMPAGAVGLMLVLVLGVNPLLGWLAPKRRLGFGQLALIFGVLLAASITPSQGGLRHILYPVGATPYYVSNDLARAEAYQQLNAPPSLFPEPLGYELDVPASEHFVDELPLGESIPWAKWRGPLWSWLAFFAPYWLMLTAIALIVLPYWRDTERQPFPLLEAQRALIENPDGRALPPALMAPLFWVGFGVVFGLHLMQGLSQYFPAAVPKVPLSFNLTPYFSEQPFRSMPGYLKYLQIHFLFLGIAYFMPNRVGMSIWFFQLVYAVYLTLGVLYTPGFKVRLIDNHRLGAWIAIPLFILWMGRHHWWAVIKSVFRRPADDAELRNKVGGTALLVGMAGVWGWLVWVGVQPGWAVVLVGVLFLFALGMTRIVAETGVPLMAPNSPMVTWIIKLFPTAWMTTPTVYFSGIVGCVAGHLNRVCATTMLCHAMGLDRNATPRRHIRLAGLFLGIILLGFVAGGVVQVALTYTHATTIDGRTSAMGFGGAGYFRWLAENPTLAFVDDRPAGSLFNKQGHILFGAALAASLMFMCQRSARWPIHPVALLFVGNWYAHRIWFSVLLGWALKMVILNYGGARGYRVARNLFLGLMIGEVAAVMCWAIVAASVAAAGGEYQVVRILPF